MISFGHLYLIWVDFAASTAQLNMTVTSQSACSLSASALRVAAYPPALDGWGYAQMQTTDSDWSGGLDVLESLTTTVFICKFITRETVRSIYQAPVEQAEHKLSEMLIKVLTWKHSTTSIMWEWPRVMLYQPWIKHCLQLLPIHVARRSVCAAYSANEVAKTLLSTNTET